MNLKSIGGIVALILAVVAVSFIAVPKNTTNADSPFYHNVTGWAWSDNIGWLSFGCDNEGTCGGVNYGVDMAQDGELSGYAWSDNIGWVTFNRNDLTGCPSSPCKAKVIPGTGEMTGWAKALSADGNGWDGWVSLSGSGSYSYGPILNALNPARQIFEGYAWGSDVVGWLKFNPYTDYEVRLSGPLCNNNNICEAGLGEDIASCSADCATADFSLQETGNLAITTVSENGASSSKVTISVVPTGGFSEDISLSAYSVSPAIPGAVYTFDTTSCALGEICAILISGTYESGTKFSLLVPPGTNEGVYTITITGVAGGLTRTAYLSLAVGSIDPGYKEF